MKRILQLFAVIIVIQAIVFILGIPEYIPKLESIINWTIFFSYLLICILFIIMFFVMIIQYGKNKKPFIEWLKPISVCVLSIMFIFLGGMMALLSSDKGLMGGHQFVKSYTYSHVDATVYIYDESFLDPAFSVSVRNGKLPIVKEIYNSGELIWEDKVVFDANKDCLYIYDYSDTTVIDSKKIMSY